MIEFKDVCIKCGNCSKVCPANVIELIDQKPKEKNINNCILCGHCYAICPTNAIEHKGLNNEEKIVLENNPIVDPKTAEIFLRSRRSCRNYKDQIVDRNTTLQLMNIGRYAPTSSNSQKISYIVIDNKETMNELKRLTVNFYKTSDDKIISILNKHFGNNAEDIIFRGAPMCIFAISDKNNIFIEDSCQFALTYIELLAPTLNLGTCWAGYLQRYLITDPIQLRNLLKIEDGKKIGKALLYGYSNENQYKMLPPRNPLEISFI